MDEHHLKPENLKKLKEFESRFEFKGIDPMGGAPYFHFWSEKEVCLDGDFILIDLKELIKLMESFE